MAAMQLTRTHRILIALVVAGAVIIAGIGFVGSYAAVRELAQEKGFGSFSTVFPIGIDAGICVLLALDLLLTWIRIPFPLLRQTAWLLTAATIAFNGAAAWPDPLGTGMHAVIPVLFVVCVEAARHAVGRIADITADKHMEGVRLTRWLLAPVPTFLLWRRMKLWELRRYDEVIKLEQDRLIYQARLQARFGRAWRRKAPIESLMPLRLARYGVPLAETASSGLAAAGIEPVLLSPVPALEAGTTAAGSAAVAPAPAATEAAVPPGPTGQAREQEPPATHESPWFAAPQVSQEAYTGTYDPAYEPAYDQQYPQDYDQGYEPGYEQEYRQGYEQGYDDPYAQGHGPQHDDPQQPQQYDQTQQPQQYDRPDAAGSPDPAQVMVPTGAGGSRPLGGVIPGPRAESHPADGVTETTGTTDSAEADSPEVQGLPEDVSREDAYFGAYRKFISENNEVPTVRQFGRYLKDLYGVTGRNSETLSDSSLRPYLARFQHRYAEELDAEHIA
ncbi:DUF2637 domain-containing protein [Streptomyces sp. NBC_01306]|uniref:DUF2637 domain-containing protein n=1 Tax=Streptomyces sp. NBC_01306 TaxID=2903819 RepID=UPI00225189B8|nr:DUF2637 domain-containing protein [Streptomyces sp. NBC_01306]MCX4724709.1 DUF2637 domain-containing protein [Streptomyces sp. NBC_01306]